MIIVSFLLDGILSTYFPFCFYFTLTSIVASSLYLKEDTLLKYSLFFGILYDISYTNTLLLNGILFFFISLFLTKIKKKTLFNMLFINLSIHILYYLIITILFLLYHYSRFDWISVVQLFESILIDTIYFMILFSIYHKHTT